MSPDRRLVTNYRPVSLLNIESKIFEKCMYEPLYEHFGKHLSKHQHGFVRGRSVTTNMLSFLQKIYEAMDKNTSDNIVTFYSDFSKAFDKVPHKELLIKVGQIVVGGCFLEVLVDYLNNRRQFVRADNTSSRILEITSGVPQGSLLGPLLFCILINDLPDVLRFSDPYPFADDLKILSIGYSDTEFQEDINAVQNWVATNKMELAVDKCAILNIRGPEKDFELLNQNLNSLQAVKDLGININARLNKANRVLYLIRRNVAYAVKHFIKLGLYKSLVLPVLLYGINCTTPSKSDLVNLEKLQRKAVRWITGRNEPYENQLRLLNFLPLPMYIHMNDLLTLSKLTQEGRDDIEIPEINKVRGRSTELYTLRKVRLEKARNEFVFKNCRLANRIDNEIIFMEPRGLKNRILNLMWKFVNKSFNTQNICTWQLCCDCHRCRNVRTIL